ncbi:hypothetical protein ACIBG7_43180 [Nonomuraea sp. NPDC050328]|uniref:hypothetical protein n=1 Tax=Nonomuraea sp. NPDC050328 TaxID=3364361 RepID=UPI0037928AA5
MSREALAVFDSRDDAWYELVRLGQANAFRAWVESQGLDPREIYRLEIYLVDCPSARVHSYAKDANGKHYLDGTDIARREPYEIALSSLPPYMPESRHAPQ